MSEAFQVGDLVRFEGEYTTGVRPFEPRNPRATVITSLGEESAVPSRIGVGVYYIDVELEVAGELVVRFTGDMPTGAHAVFSEQTFQVIGAGQVAHRSLPPQLDAPAPDTAVRARAREMMLEDLRASGFAVRADANDEVVAIAHAGMRDRARQTRAAFKPTTLSAPVPLARPKPAKTKPKR